MTWRQAARAALGLGLAAWFGAARAEEAPAAAAPATAGTEVGFAVFQTRCMGCHGNPDVPRAPQPAAIRQMSPERIYEALTSGAMKGQGGALSEDQRRIVAVFMSGRPFGSLQQGDAGQMPNRCAANPQMAAPDAARDWNGWGGNPSNDRFKTRSGLTAADVPRLKLKWAFGYPGGLSAFGQPTVVAGRVFVGTDTGYVYSLDAKTGCVYWSYQAKGTVRSAVKIAPVKGVEGVRYGVFFGDFHANVYGLDAQTGRPLWTTQVSDHFVARITAGVAAYGGRLFVPVSSSEEFTAASLDYPCCTNRGSVAALDAATGRRLWTAWVVDQPRPTRKNSKGVQQYAPSGGSVWNSPTVDPKRGAIYFGTGEANSQPVSPNTDAMIAIGLDVPKGITLKGQLRQKKDTAGNVVYDGANNPMMELSPESFTKALAVGLPGPGQRRLRRRLLGRPADRQLSADQRPGPRHRQLAHPQKPRRRPAGAGGRDQGRPRVRPGSGPRRQAVVEPAGAGQGRPRHGRRVLGRGGRRQQGL